MASYCFDSSAILKRWLEEVGSDRVRALTAVGDRHRLYVASLAVPEVVGAVARRHKDLPTDVRDALCARIRREITARVRVLDITPALWRRATEFAAAQALRGADAVHVAVAVGLRDVHRAGGADEPVFVTADREQATAAASVGLTVELLS